MALETLVNALEARRPKVTVELTDNLIFPNANSSATVPEDGDPSSGGRFPVSLRLFVQSSMTMNDGTGISSAPLFTAQASTLPSTVTPQQVVTGTVQRVVNGDLVLVKPNSGNEIRVRLFGVAVPEGGNQEGSQAYLQKLIEGKQVKVEIYRTIQSGDHLGTVFLGNDNINLKMVEAGYSKAFRPRNTGQPLPPTVDPYVAQYLTAEKGSKATAISAQIQFTPESALQLLLDSQQQGGHPGDHIPLNGRTNAQMLERAKERAAAHSAGVTSYYYNLNEKDPKDKNQLGSTQASIDLAHLLNANSKLLESMKVGERREISPKRTDTVSTLSEPRTINVYHHQNGKLRTGVSSSRATVIVDRTDKGYRIFTFYPMEK